MKFISRKQRFIIINVLVSDLKVFQNSKDLYLLDRYEKIESSTHRADQLNEQEHIDGAIGDRMY